MKTLTTVLSALFLFFTLATTSYAIQIYVDSSSRLQPEVDRWFDESFDKIANGTFINMAGGSDPNNVGTTNHDARDRTVYSFGNRGRVLVFAYWLPDTTAANIYHRLTTNLSATYNNYSVYDSGWWRPQLYNHAGGVVGIEAFQRGYSYPEEKFDSILAVWNHYEGSVTLKLKLDNQITSLTSNRFATPPATSGPSEPAPVPEPTTALLLGSGLAGLAFYRRKMRKSLICSNYSPVVQETSSSNDFVGDPAF